jgi:predicted O-methyltransferase YrrM
MLPDELSQRIRAFQESRVLLTAIELDLFTAIGQGATTEQAASALGANARATGMLMNALVSLGMLEKRDGVFRNSPEAARYFVKGSPDDQRMATMHIVNLWTRWSTLTGCVRSGTAVERRETAGRGDDWTEAFIAAMHANASERAPAVVRAVGTEGVDRMLDIGGGSGAYSIAFAKANPRLQAEILDLESVLPIARRHIAEAGVADRVRARTGDLRAGGFGTGYGLVFISAICHMLAPEENQELLANSFAALAPGGRVAVQDFILDPDRTGPRIAALFALNMLVGTASGNTYTEEEYASWLRAAGFAGVRRVKLPGPADLMLATRAA